MKAQCTVCNAEWLPSCRDHLPSQEGSGPTPRWGQESYESRRAYAQRTAAEHRTISAHPRLAERYGLEREP